MKRNEFRAPIRPLGLAVFAAFLLLGGATAFADEFYSDSLDFTLDTTGGAAGLYADSADFTLNTTGGASGLYADSTDFTLDTTGGSSGLFAESADFILDTTGGASGLYADSGDFTLNTTGQPGGSRGVAFADSGDFELNTTGVSSGGSGTASADSADFTLDTTSEVPLPSGAVAWWRAEGNALDEFVGHPGELWNGASYATGYVGLAFSLAGPNQFVAVASAPGVSLGATAPMTVELWAYRTGSGTPMHLVGKRSDCGVVTPNYELALDPDTGAGLYFGAGTVAASGVDLPLNTWTHVAGTFDGTAFRIYVNGDLKATQAGTLGPENSAPLVIGGSGDCFYFVGRLDEVTLYDRALSAPEILAIYTAGAGGKGTDTPVITTLAALPGAKLNTAYSQTLAATLGTAPYTFAPVGPMPPGLALSSAGVIGGAPTSFGNVSFTAQVTDALGKSSTKMFSLSVLPYSGSVFAWNGGNADWSSAANWIPNGVPGPNDFATINSGVVSISTDRSVAQLNLAGGTIDGGGTLTINGVLNWTYGQMSGAGARTLIGPTATCNLGGPGGVGLGSRTLENAGRINWIGTGKFTLGDSSGTPGVVTNRPGALFDIQNDAELAFYGYGENYCAINNGGIFRKSAGIGTNTIGHNFNNYGTNEVQTGTVLFGGQFNNNGRLQVAAGATNRVVNAGVSSGTFAVDLGGLMDFSASGPYYPHNLNAGAQLIGTGVHRLSGGTLSVNGDVPAQNLEISGGTLTGAGTLTVNGVLNWTYGQMSGAGARTLIGPTATCNLGGPGGVGLGSRTLENAGRINWIGTGKFTLGDSSGTPGVVTNRPGALFDIQNDAELAFYGYGENYCAINNGGIFRKSAGTGTNTIAHNFNNYGTNEVQTGTVLFGGQFNNGGRLQVAAGATNRVVNSGVSSGTFAVDLGGLMDFSASAAYYAHNLNAGAQLTGAGVHRLSGGTLSVNGDVPAQNLEISGGELTGGGTLTVNGVLNWTYGQMSGAGARTLIAPAATCNLGSASRIDLGGRTLENAGRINWIGTGKFVLGDSWGNSGVVTNRPGALFDIQNDSELAFYGYGENHCTINNGGTFRKSAGPGTTTVSAYFNNYGTNEVISGTLQLTPYTQYAGLTFLNGGNILNSSPLQILGGIVGGNGTISGGVNNVGATVSPGASPGLLTIGGNYTQGANGTLAIEVAGTTPGTTYDRLVIGGSATLDGTLRTTLANGFYPSANANFMFLTTASSSGAFAAIYYPSNDVGEQVVYSANSASVKIINVRPSLPAITPQTIDEMVLFTLPVGATDDDTPAQTLSYALINAPVGATVNGSGAINWTPTEEQGPMTTNITVRVTDNGTPNLSATNTFTVVVNEVNVAPALGTLSDQTVNPGQTVSFTATATDSDLPANALSFSLLNPPAGATMTSGGLFNWRAGVALRDTTNAIQVRVQDNGSPVLNETRLFSVIVNPLAVPVVLTPLGFANGQFTLGVTGPLGPDYVIMMSTNLTQWNDQTTNLSPVLPFQHADPQAGAFSNRAYRVRLQP